MFRKEVDNFEKMIKFLKMAQGFRDDRGNEVKVSAQVRKISPFLYQINLDGEDQFGTFEAKGFIVCKSGKDSLVWGMQAYDFHGSRAAAVYIYESFKFNSEEIIGSSYRKDQPNHTMKWSAKNPEKVHTIKDFEDSENQIQK